MHLPDYAVLHPWESCVVPDYVVWDHPDLITYWSRSEQRDCYRIRWQFRHDGIIASGTTQAMLFVLWEHPEMLRTEILDKAAKLIARHEWEAAHGKNT